MENVIILENISKIYKLYNNKKDRLKESFSLMKKKYHKDFYALDKVTLKIKKGEVIGLIGKNGAGKSTLLKIITGVLTPNEGSVKVNGKISALIELGAGFNPEYTGMENIYLYGTLMGYSKSESEKKVNDIIEFSDIGEFINQPVKTYSSGMFARLAFACAINVEPDILIVDEILSVGDLRFQLKCMKKMNEMLKGGTTVIFVSHDMNAIKMFCSRIFWINNGKIEMQGETNYVTDYFLDYLESSDTKVELENNKEVNNDAIVKIKEIEILNKNGVNSYTFSNEVKTYIKVKYQVFDLSIKNPVLGVAIKKGNDEYVCGLNTLLDNIQIPWELGENVFYLEYTIGTLLNGGTYYIDCAFFEETASVLLIYKKRVKEFFIQSDYKGIGEYIIPHLWRREVNGQV